jgi:hypothetical protein
MKKKENNAYLRCCHTPGSCTEKHFEFYRKELFEAFDLVHNETRHKTMAIEELQQGGIDI